jgi:S-formylglutathione hydrolase
MPASTSTYCAHAGYDHGYYFVQSFVPEHLAFHAARLTV